MAPEDQSVDDNLPNPPQGQHQTQSPTPANHYSHQATPMPFPTPKQRAQCFSHQADSAHRSGRYCAQARPRNPSRQRCARRDGARRKATRTPFPHPARPPASRAPGPPLRPSTPGTCPGAGPLPRCAGPWCRRRGGGIWIRLLLPFGHRLEPGLRMALDLATARCRSCRRAPGPVAAATVSGG